MLTCNVINGLQNRTDRNRTHWTDRGVFYKSPPVRACAFQNFVETGSHLSNLSSPVFVSFCDRLTHFPQHAPRNTLDTLSANLLRESCAPRLASCRCCCAPTIGDDARARPGAIWAGCGGLLRVTCMLIVRCPAATWAHGAMPMPGQHVGGYLHGYLLTIGG